MSIRLVGHSRYENAHPPRSVDPQTRGNEDRGMEALAIGIVVVAMLSVLAVVAVWSAL